MRRLAFLLIAVQFLLAACGRLDPPERSGELVVGVLNDPVFFQKETAEEAASGIENDLAAAFADELGVRLRFVVADSQAELLKLLRAGKIHFVAAAPVSPGTADLRYSAPLRVSAQVIVQHVDSIPIDAIGDLEDHQVEVLAGAPELATLRGLQPSNRFTVAEIAATDELELLKRVAERQADLAAVDRAHFEVAANFYPDLDLALELPGKVSYAWAFRSDDAVLLDRAEAFIARIRQDGTLVRLDDRYFGHIRRVGPNNMTQFLQLMQTRLPHFRADFHQAQLLTGIDWRLLAALAYQESNWDPLATSPTGVRGMMMLTEDTADRMRVGNRLDPHQSILAGARYLAELMEMMPPEAVEPDRTWLALSAYNLGPGHFGGAKAIARGLKRDPASWYDMKKVLPLLARPEYYQRLKSGRARGGEAVIMVENIRNFYDVLCRFERPYVPVVRPQ